MSAADPRPSATRCTCGDQAGSHRRNSKGQRARCTRRGCGCRMFVSAKVAAR